MSLLLQLLLILSLIVALAKAAGWLSARLGQPAVFGELLVGLLLGPSVLNLFGWSAFAGAGAEEVVLVMAELGVILLMLIAGMEVDLRDLRRAGKTALLAGVLGVILPLLGGWCLSRLFGYGSNAAFAVGVLLTATSVSISAQTLLELGVLRSPEGIALLGAAVVDDVLVILILSLETVFWTGQTGVGSILLVVGRMVLFLGCGGFLCLWGLPRLMRRVERWPISAAVPTVALVATFFTAWAADFIGGVAAITGAFLVGLGLRRSQQHRAVVEAVHSIGYALFVPLFFVSVGLQADVRALDGRLVLFGSLLILVAVVTKVLGSSLGAMLGGFKPPSALRVGTGMISRGEVGLIVATVEIREGWLDEHLFAVVMLLVLVSTLLTPPLLKRAFRSARPSRAPAEPRPGEKGPADAARGKERPAGEGTAE